MPYDERWLADVLARGQVRLVDGAMPVGPPAVSEKAFMAAVVRLARQHGWEVWHAYSAKKSAAGYPDLTMAKAGAPLLMIETKTDTGQLTKAQEAWLTALAGSTGVVSACWRPSMWEEICRTLRG